MNHAWLWIAFIVFVLAMLALDLGLFNRKAHVIKTSEALRWTGVCVVLALLFTIAVYYIYQNDFLGFGSSFVNEIRQFEIDKIKVDKPDLATWVPPPDNPAAIAEANRGKTAAIQFLTGWLVEYSLSMDNIFVIALIFGHFKVPPKYQHRVLFWGILGALIMRGAMIAMGSALITTFHWILYIFGAFLVFTGIKIALAGDNPEVSPENNIAIRLARRIFPITKDYHEQKFFIQEPFGNATRLAATPLFLVLLVVETTDVVFAVDSIPAIFSITRDPFLVFTSNVFAILGLRSLYFALSGLMGKFDHLKYSLAFILVFVGVKMLLEYFHIEISGPFSLIIIIAALILGVVSSLIAASKKAKASPTPVVPEAKDPTP